MIQIGLATITRHQLPSGKFRYEQNGDVHTKASTRLYTHASAYRAVIAQVGTEPVTVKRTSPRDIREFGPTYESTRPVFAPIPEGEQQTIVFLHARADLALKGSPDGNRLVQNGHWVRVPGIVEVEEATA